MYNFNPYSNVPMPNNQNNNNNMQPTYPNNMYGYGNYAQRSVINQYTYVNGLEGAKAFNIAPNQSVLLMDSDNPVFYLKTSNNQ